MSNDTNKMDLDTRSLETLLFRKNLTTDHQICQTKIEESLKVIKENLEALNINNYQTPTIIVRFKKGPSQELLSEF